MISLRKSVLLVGLMTATAATSLVALPVQAQEFNSGNVIGGSAGALLGSNVGRGNGRLAATAAAGIVGALVGGNIERNSGYYSGYAPQPAYTPQQSYTYNNVQPALQYQQNYGNVTYEQPGYAPIYTQPSYAYVQPPATVVYSRSYYRGDRDYGERYDRRYGERYDQRHEWHGDEHRDHGHHDRDDHYDR